MKFGLNWNSFMDLFRGLGSSPADVLIRQSKKQKDRSTSNKRKIKALQKRRRARKQAALSRRRNRQNQ